MVLLTHVSAAVALLAAVAQAEPHVPNIPGYNRIWHDDFDGPQGGHIDWNNNWIQLHRDKSENGNQEVNHYRNGTRTAQLSGDGKLWIIPQKEGNEWVSARLHSKPSWTCPPGKKMVIQAEIIVPNFAGSPTVFQGLWPAFWAMGQSQRQGVAWPKCGEWDIMEVANNRGNLNEGTIHFAAPGPAKPDGKYDRISRGAGRTAYEGGKYHTWAFKIDRTSGNWRDQVMTWYMDGKDFAWVYGRDINNEGQWRELAHSPYFAILNVAIGGAFAGGKPHADLRAGLDSAMRVKYVAVYHSQ